MQETWVQSLGWEDLLKKGKATHSSILVAKSQTWLSNLHITFTSESRVQASLPGVLRVSKRGESRKNWKLSQIWWKIFMEGPEHHDTQMHHSQTADIKQTSSSSKFFTIIIVCVWETLCSGKATRKKQLIPFKGTVQLPDNFSLEILETKRH